MFNVNLKGPESCPGHIMMIFKLVVAWSEPPEALAGSTIKFHHSDDSESRPGHTVTVESVAVPARSRKCRDYKPYSVVALDIECQSEMPRL